MASQRRNEDKCIVFNEFESLFEKGNLLSLLDGY